MDKVIVEPTTGQLAHARYLTERAERIDQPTVAAQLSLVLDQLADHAKTIRADYTRGARVSGATFAHLDATDRLLALLQPRNTVGEPDGIAVTVMGLDIYVHDRSDQLAVSVNADEADKPAVVESFDGVSWEHPLP